MTVLFVNLTNHKLNNDQLNAIKELNVDEILEKEDLFNEDIIEQLKQSPDNKEELIQLAELVVSTISDLATRNIVFVHLPIGSPAFQYVLNNKLSNIPNTLLVFSHTKRIVIEDGDKKISQFKFEKFIIFESNTYIPYNPYFQS